MIDEHCRIAYAVVIKIWSNVCKAYRNIDSCDNSELGLTATDQAEAAARPISCPLPGSTQFLLSVIWDTFTFESDKLRVLCRIVGRNQYRSVTDAVFGNRLPDHVFSTGILPTDCFLQCRLGSCIYARDSVLSFLYRIVGFVGIVGKNQIM